MNVKSILLSSLATLSLLSCQSEQVSLVFNTKAAQSQVYILRSQMKMIVSEDTSAPAALNSRMEARVISSHLVSYDDGSARYQMVADSVSYTSDQRSVEECSHIERYLAQQEFQFKMNPAGEMQDLRMGEFVPDLDRTDIDLRRLLVKIQPVLPGKPVQQGSSWERQHLFSGDSGRKSYVYKWFEVEDLFERDGKRFARMRMNLKYRLDDQSDQGPNLQSDDFILGSGEVLFNIDAGYVEEGSLEITGKLNVLNESKSKDSLPEMRVRQLISMRRLG